MLVEITNTVVTLNQKETEQLNQIASLTLDMFNDAIRTQNVSEPMERCGISLDDVTGLRNFTAQITDTIGRS